MDRFDENLSRFSILTEIGLKILVACLAGLLLFSITGCAPERLQQEKTSSLAESSEEELPNKVDPSQLPDSSFIYDASIASLEDADSYMNGQTVQVTGEVVGDRINASTPDYCWITLQANDGTGAEISVFMPMSSSELISNYGSYGHHGTDLQVRGTFNLACKDHTGLSDLHAQNVALVNPGYALQEDVSFVSFIPGIVLIFIGAGLFFLYRYLKEREL